MATVLALSEATELVSEAEMPASELTTQQQSSMSAILSGKASVMEFKPRAEHKPEPQQKEAPAKDAIAPSLEVLKWFQRELGDFAPVTMTDQQVYYGNLIDEHQKLVDRATVECGVGRMQAMAALIMVGQFSRSITIESAHPRFHINQPVFIKRMINWNGHPPAENVPAVIHYMDEEDTLLYVGIDCWGFPKGRLPIWLPTAQLDEYLSVDGK